MVSFCSHVYESCNDVCVAGVLQLTLIVSSTMAELTCVCWWCVAADTNHLTNVCVLVHDGRSKCVCWCTMADISVCVGARWHI